MILHKNRTYIDNSKLSDKLALRRRFLDRYGATSVFDCCQGDQHIWSQLRKEYAVKYFGVDRKLKSGRLSILSERVLSIPGHDFDVIDVDTYGSPFTHYSAACKTITRPCTIFMTIGALNRGITLSWEALRNMGIHSTSIPISLRGKIWDFYVKYCLTQVSQYGIILVEAEEIVSTAQNARYIAVRIERK